jgi:tripartite-type tricarboxylate transporter receptor subunit TctC
MVVETGLSKPHGLLIAALLLMAGFGLAPPANADAIADFYKGKTVALVVGSSTGGGYDTMTRAIARFIGRHVPGNPTVVVRTCRAPAASRP